MNIIMNNINNGSDGSQPAGSPEVNGNVPANAGETDYKAMYEELEKKLGEQGKELGDFRKFFENVSPILDKLDVSPTLIQAILEDKIDDKLAKAVLDGQIKIEDAQTVSKAHEDVKKELGKKYDTLTPDQVEKLISEKVSEVQKDFKRELNEAEELRDFEKSTTDFIASKSDFSEYADEIQQWLDDHPDQDDISVAYAAVKGEHLEEERKKGTGALNKEIAANAGGGGSSVTSIPAGTDPFGSLVSNRKNPNEF